MFDKAQVMEFKDAFSIMDTNSDGLVDMNDLKITFERLGNAIYYRSIAPPQLTFSFLTFRSTSDRRRN